MTVADRQGLFDAKRINHALFGAYYEEDIYDRACGALPRAAQSLWWRLPAAMRSRALIFVHVPRVAGASISHALYGPGTIRHHSMRYYQAIDPAFCARADSFALLRDPLDRFASAYSFLRQGGTPVSRLSAIFVRLTAGIRSVEDYLSFLEDRDPLDLDFVMRPQSWFICDAGGEPLVKRLFLYGQDWGALAVFLQQHGVQNLPWLNRAPRSKLSFTDRQLCRIQALYAQDFALVARLRAAEAWNVAVRTAAE